MSLDTFEARWAEACKIDDIAHAAIREVCPSLEEAFRNLPNDTVATAYRLAHASVGHDTALTHPPTTAWICYTCAERRT